MRIDNTAHQLFLTCPAKFNLRMIQNWAPKKVSSALNAGKVLHSGLEEWYRSGNLVTSLQACRDAWPAGIISDDFRNLEKVLSTLVSYTRKYDAEPWKIVGAAEGDPQVECSFTVPTGFYLNHCEACGFDNSGLEGWNGTQSQCANCGADLEPIEYGGIFDLLVEWAGTIYVVDHKTTTQFGQYYHTQWKPNNQITGYVWGAQQMSGRRVGGAVINVIAWYKASATKFDRHITTRDPADITAWLENVRQVANLIHRAKILNEFPMNTGSCTMYGKCEYHRVHEMSDERQQRGMLQMYYEQRPWDFERRDEEPAANGQA